MVTSASIFLAFVGAIDKSLNTVSSSKLIELATELSNLYGLYGTSRHTLIGSDDKVTTEADVLIRSGRNQISDFYMLVQLIKNQDLELEE